MSNTPDISSPSFSRQALAVLNKFYGYKSFRPGQYEIIQALAAGRDALVLMPTGGGKSLCYQIPALLAAEGCAIVVSPLIALMQDQTQALVANGIPAAAIHSNQSEDTNRDILNAVYMGRIKLLYISPERLLMMLEGWERMKISLFAIDEAHCISQWGHDFRPDYAQLCRLKQLRPDVPMIALTATADRLTRDDIRLRLGLNNPFEFVSSFDRPNISLRAYANPGKKARIGFIASMVRKYPQDSGIAYCLSRSGAEATYQALKASGIKAVCYHAGMNPADRDRSMNAFLDGRAQVVCATVAFGMGIDKSNIRWVVHNNMPSNIESYYQEIGRAGRDGLPAEAVLFHSYADVITLRNFAEESGRQAVNYEKLSRMQAYAEARVCRRRILLSYFSEESTHDCGNCDVCLNPPSRIDGTILAQKALSAVARTGSKIGVFTLVNILRGSLRSDIRQAGYDRIKTFGAGSDLSQNEWTNYISQMIQLGIFEIAYEDSNHLRITPLGVRILRGLENVELSTFVPPTTAKSRKNNVYQQDTKTKSPTEQLFEHLKTIRTDIARQEGLPPYIIFSDATLMDMATKKPKDIDGILEVNGVGERKAVRFGKKFIAAIRKFDGLTASSPAGSSIKETLILINAGTPVGEIARLKGVKTDTIYSHIAKLIDDDMITTYGSFITRKQFEMVREAFLTDPDNAYTALEGKIEPALISVARAIARATARRKSQENV